MNKLIRIYKYFLETFGIILVVKNWWVVYLGYLNLIDLSEGMILNLRNGLKFKIIHYLDALVISEIFWKNDYRFEMFGSGSVVIDIGANIGVLSIYASFISPKSKIYAFEPSKRTYKQLLENIKLNKVKNVIPINKAIFSKRGKLKLYDNGMSGQRSIYEKDEKVKYETVAVTTFNDIMKNYKIKHVDFLKLDCEGAEYEIFKKLSKENFQKIDRISLEYHELQKDQRASFLGKALERQGFKVNIKKHQIEKNIGYVWATKKKNLIN